MKNKGRCTSCENYFWKGELSPLPMDLLRLNRKYCPSCYPDVLEEHTKLYFGYT